MAKGKGKRKSGKLQGEKLKPEEEKPKEPVPAPFDLGPGLLEYYSSHAEHILT
jgi:hypothetical protein